MKLSLGNCPVNYEKAFGAYLLAVTSASLSFTILIEGSAMFSSGGFETATTYDLFTKSQDLLLMTLGLTVISWIVTFVAAIIPFMLSISVGRHFNISHWSYFVGGGVFTALALLLLVIFFDFGTQESAPSFWQQYLRVIPLSLICGSISGLVCWKYLRREATFEQS